MAYIDRRYMYENLGLNWAGKSDCDKEDLDLKLLGKYSEVCANPSTLYLYSVHSRVPFVALCTATVPILEIWSRDTSTLPVRRRSGGVRKEDAEPGRRR